LGPPLPRPRWKYQDPAGNVLAETIRTQLELSDYQDPAGAIRLSGPSWGYQTIRTQLGLSDYQDPAGTIRLSGPCWGYQTISGPSWDYQTIRTLLGLSDYQDPAGAIRLSGPSWDYQTIGTQLGLSGFQTYAIYPSQRLSLNECILHMYLSQRWSFSSAISSIFCPIHSTIREVLQTEAVVMVCVMLECVVCGCVCVDACVWMMCVWMCMDVCAWMCVCVDVCVCGCVCVVCGYVCVCVRSEWCVDVWCSSQDSLYPWKGKTALCKYCFSSPESMKGSDSAYTFMITDLPHSPTAGPTLHVHVTTPDPLPPHSLTPSLLTH